jgi:predicted GNAT family acetyltransferase
LLHEVINDKQGSRFVLTDDGNEVYVLYSLDQDTLDLYSTFTPPQLRGKGLASLVVKAAFEYAKENKLNVIPTCSYVRWFVSQHKEYQSNVLDSDL